MTQAEFVSPVQILGGRRRRLPLLSTVAALTLAVWLSQPAQAAPLPIPPPFHAQDENGVDVTTGRLTVASPAISIGPAQGGLSFQSFFETVTGNPGDSLAEPWNNNWVTMLDLTKVGSDSKIYLVHGNTSEAFTSATAAPTATLQSDLGNGATLKRTPGVGQNDPATWEYISSTGAVTSFTEIYPAAHAGHFGYPMQSVRRPDGVQTSLQYSYNYSTGTPDAQVRVDSISTNAGYQLHFEYQTNEYQNPANQPAWRTISKVTALNNFKAYCAPAAPCAPPQSTTNDGNPWPQLAFSYASIGTPTTTHFVTTIGVSNKADISGNRIFENTKYYFHAESGTSLTSFRRLAGINYPESTNTSLNFDDRIYYDNVNAPGFVSKYEQRIPLTGSANTAVTEYQFATSTLVTDVTVKTSDTAANKSTYTGFKFNGVRVPGLVGRFKNGVGQEWTYDYDARGRLIESVAPEQNSVRLTYSADGRGNVTKVTRVPKPNSGLNQTFSTATFPTCTTANLAVCNKPLSITDARDATTDFTYDASHGGVLTVTGPADNSGDRPRTVYGYQSIKATAGGFFPGPPIVKLVSVSSCRTDTLCNGTSNQTITEFSYTAPGSQDTRNLLPVVETTRDGANTISVATTTIWSDLGDPSTIDGPLGVADGLTSDSADLVRLHYDGRRRLIGMAGPMADAAVSSTRRSMRMEYNKEGQTVRVERGTVAADYTTWTNFNSNFTALERTANEYDIAGRLSMTREGVGTSDRSVVRMSYDRAHRPTCTALRMTLNATQTDACSVVDQNNPDRITKFVYDAADRVLEQWSAYDSTIAQKTSTFTYSSNGLTTRRTDSRGVVMNYEYDGFDRLFKIKYPNPGNGSVSSTTDFEQFAYDEEDNISSWQDRDGLITYFTVDNLGRTIGIARPSEPGVFITYDLFDQTISTYKGAGTVGRSVSNVYDPLGRLIQSTNSGTSGGQNDDRLGTVRMRYDRGGRMTRLTWPDYFKDSAPLGQVEENDYFYVSYDYNLYDQMKTVIERPNVFNSGSNWLAGYTYNDLGQMVSIWRPNNAFTFYSYDSLRRLSAIQHDPVGTGADQIWSFSWNNAGQLAARTSGNQAYAPLAPAASATTSYTNNSLDQYVTVGGAGLTHDTRGNLINDGGTVAGTGARTYAYDRSGNLTAVAQGSTPVMELAYDPVNRLMQTTSGASGEITLFLHAGGQLIGEMNAIGAITRRYVPGADPDAPIMVYQHDGGGIPARRWLHYDDLGSVAAVTDRLGRAIRINSYDSFGVPAAGNWGRIGFAGREWLPEVNIWHSRARAYAPTLGRFLQPDPIGMAGGANLYGYASSDPLNRIDPTGLWDDGGGGGGGICAPWDIRCDIPTSPWDPSQPRRLGEVPTETVVVTGERALEEVFIRIGLDLADIPNSLRGRTDRLIECLASAIHTPVLLPGYGQASSVHPCGDFMGGNVTVAEFGGDVAAAAITWTPTVRGATISADVAGHIFKNAGGHVVGRTPEIRQRYMDLFERVRADSRNFVGTDSYGVSTFRRNFGPNLQVWVEVAPRGNIKSAGVNRGGGRR